MIVASLLIIVIVAPSLSPIVVFCLMLVVACTSPLKFAAIPPNMIMVLVTSHLLMTFAIPVMVIAPPLVTIVAFPLMMVVAPPTRVLKSIVATPIIMRSVDSSLVKTAAIPTLHPQRIMTIMSARIVARL